MCSLYELSDHPGNVTTTFSENIETCEEKRTVGGSVQTTLYQVPEIGSFTDYTPFGLNVARINDNALTSTYRYGFNGKEQDDNGEWGDLTHYDYGFRIYNPAIARFLSVDPLSPEYPWYTLYQFAGNMPIANADMDGLEPLEKITAASVTGDGTVVLDVANDWIVITEKQSQFGVFMCALSRNRFDEWRSQGGGGLSSNVPTSGVTGYASGLVDVVVEGIGAPLLGAVALPAVVEGLTPQILGPYTKNSAINFFSEAIESIIFGGEMDYFDIFNPANIATGKLKTAGSVANGLINF